ncbi:MAG: zinc ribbon domain-containing protein [Flaviflexus sp.]|uniref:zinc ribbon domain-containing protein n=1 Tax=Flaviflexus sp. TaxID=1969482 RepID=UPI003F93C6D9
MKASAEDQNLLIDLSSIDGDLQRLRHKLANLPVYAELTDAEHALKEHRSAAAARAARKEPIEATIAEAETKVEQLTAAITRKQSQLDSGEGMDSRQLMVLQGEIDGFKESRDDVEMSQLEAMEQLEAIEADTASDKAEDERLDGARLALVKRKDDEVAGVESEIAGVQENRSALTSRIAPPLVEAYEESRMLSGTGVVIMRTDGTVDGGLDLSLIEIEQIKAMAADEVYLTEDTGAVVVRQG